MKDAKLVPTLVIALTGLALAAPAWAQNTLLPEVTVHAPRHPAAGGEIKSEVVKYADLDVSKDAGAKALIGRIRAAATRVCSPAPTHAGNLKDNADYKTCRDDAVATAVQDVANPTVQQVFKRNGG